MSTSQRNAASLEDPQAIWETYTQSWKAKGREAKLALFADSLNDDCEYRDPTIHTKGWEELAQNMANFHEQIPGGHFVTTWFLAHHGRSIAKWNMCDEAGTKLSEGVSYGEYDAYGRLLSMTGFFEA